MNSWSSADSGPLSSRPAGPPAPRARLQAHGQRGNRQLVEVRLEAACGLVSLLLAEPAELRAVLVVVRLELHQHLEDGGGVVEAARGEVRLDHLRVGLRHQRVVARLAVELDQLAQAADVGGVALDDLLEDRGAAVDLAALHELVHGRQDLLEGLVVAPLGQVHLPELQARVLVRGVSLEQGLEDRAGVVRPLRAEAGLREPQRHLAVGGGGPPRLLEVLDRAREVLLDEVDAGRGREEAWAARPRAQGLLDELQRLGQVALLDQLLGDGHVLVGGLLQVAVARVELRQADADLHVRGVDLGHAAQDVARVADPVALDVLVDHEAEGLLGLGHEALPGVEVPQRHVALEHGRVVAEDLLPDRDRLQVEAVLGEVPGNLDVLLVGGLEVVELGVQVPDAVDDVPVASGSPGRSASGARSPCRSGRPSPRRRRPASA